MIKIVAIVIFVTIILGIKYLIWNFSTLSERLLKKENTSTPEELKQLYLLGVFQLAGYVGGAASSDGAEISRVVAEFIRRLTPNGENTELCISAYNTGRNPNYQVTSGIRFIRTHERNSGKRTNLDILMTFIITVALCDNVLTDMQRFRLQEIATLLNYPPRKFAELMKECQIMKEWQNFRDSEYGGFSGAYGSYSGTGGSRSGESFYGNSGYDRSRYDGGYNQGSGQNSWNSSGQGSWNDSGSSWNQDNASGQSWQEDKSLQKAFAILGVPATASDSQIKKAYHRLIRKYHPDMIKARGLPEEMEKVYADKAQEINDAYTIITRARG
jgi:DnaJ-domain-containing protein 1